MIRRFGVVVGALALVAAFQNCNKQNLSGNSGAPNQTDQLSVGGEPPTGKPPEQVTSGGGNYDGKVWAVVDATVTCGDGSHEVARLRGSSVGFQLERANCAPVNPPTLVAMAEVAMDASGSFLIYKQQAFTAQPSAVVPAPPALQLVCDATPGDLPITMLFYAGTPLTGRVISYADANATVVRLDSGVVNVAQLGQPVADYNGRKGDGTVAFDLSLLGFPGPQKFYLGSGVNISVQPGGTLNADKFDSVRSGNVLCRKQ